MVSKNLLIISAEQNIHAPYTHIVLVDVFNNSNSSEYGYFYENNSLITPEYIEDMLIDTLLSSEKSTTMEISAEMGVNNVQIYLGRSDYKKNYGIGKFESYISHGIVSWNSRVFTEADIEKEIPIWLSTTPPPY